MDLSIMEAEQVTWGIAGAANIARKNIRAILDSPRTCVAEICSRDQAKGERFWAENVPDDITPRVVSLPYEAFAQRGSVFACLYCPLPVAVKLPVVVGALKAGVHVLVEKPAGKDVAEVMAMIAAATEPIASSVPVSSSSTARVFMDGTMFMHHTRTLDWFKVLRGRAQEHAGRLSVHSCFHFNGGGADSAFFKDNIRATSMLDPAGALGDLGHYCIRAALMAGAALPVPETAAEGSVFIWQGERIVWPVLISAQCTPLDGGSCGPPEMIDGCIVNLLFDRLTVNFTCSFKEAFQQDLCIKYSSLDAACGDLTITMDDFVIPNSPEVASYKLSNIPASGPFDDFDRRVTRTTTTRTINDCCQEKQMFETFSALTSAGHQDPDKEASKEFYRAVVVVTQTVQDLCEASFRHEGERKWA